MRMAFLIMAAMLIPGDLHAQDAAPIQSPPPAPGTLTVKERLSAKWKDEQRVDNCNVPPEKRGSKPRPDACDNPKSK